MAVRNLIYSVCLPDDFVAGSDCARLSASVVIVAPDWRGLVEAEIKGWNVGSGLVLP